jgi:hypothetical protein
MEHEVATNSAGYSQKQLRDRERRERERRQPELF